MVRIDVRVEDEPDDQPTIIDIAATAVEFVKARKLDRHKGHIPYNDRPFVSWDGEGVTVQNSDGSDNHCYILFGTSNNEFVTGPNLTTVECLRLITTVGKKYGNAVIHISYAFSYDVNMILRDLDKRALFELQRTGKCLFATWLIEWRRGKWFSVYSRTENINVKIFDIFTFFAKSAVAALKEFLPNDPRIPIVAASKAQRDTFRYDQLDEIKRYWELEGTLYVELATELRKHLLRVGLPVSSWHGPGAVAQKVLTNYRVKITRELPERVTSAAQGAYFGGRFEQLGTGKFDVPIYTYDIRSAYPHILRLLPDLSAGQWKQHVSSYVPHADNIRQWSLYRVEFCYTPVVDNPFLQRFHLWPMPLPHRNFAHQVRYPFTRNGWVWGIELTPVVKHMPGTVIVHEEWQFETATDNRPFAFIEGMYQRRAEMKAQGISTQLALKLSMNSVYGKLAQRVGWKVKDRTPPRWHQLEYAGMITAGTRAMIFDAMYTNDPRKVLLIETDGIVTMEPMELPLGKALGEWEEETFDSAVIVQNGVYWLRRGDEWVKAKTRGWTTGQLNVDTALAVCDDLGTLTSTRTRFIGMGVALRSDMNRWRKWLESSVTYEWGGGGKRRHHPDYCLKCQGYDWPGHTTAIVNGFRSDTSSPHILPWRDSEYNEYWDADDEIIE